MIHMMTVLTGLGNYVVRVMMALSVLLNVLLGGQSNQTFSARNHGWQRMNLPNLVFLIDAVLGKDHCLKSWVYWKVRRL